LLGAEKKGNKSYNMIYIPSLIAAVILLFFSGILIFVQESFVAVAIPFTIGIIVLAISITLYLKEGEDWWRL